MKWLLSITLMFCFSYVFAADSRVILLSKRQMLNSNYTHVVLFYDQEIRTISDCQRDIYRGKQDRWRYYQHSFPKPKGYSEMRSYYCIETEASFDHWFDKAPYAYIYQIDIRAESPMIKKMDNYAACLKDLRKSVKDEIPRYFCAKLSQQVD